MSARVCVQWWDERRSHNQAKDHDMKSSIVFSGKKPMFNRDKNSKSANDETRETSSSFSETVTATLLAPQTPQTNDAHSVSRHAAIPPVVAPIVLPREARGEAKHELKKLIVGKGISLDGKISSCDRLIVDGKVEAELQDCHTVEITENGNFKGAAEIAGAEISGHYEGSLTVRENLLIRATGRVTGTVRYGKLHIEDGGEINGDVKSITAKI
jgi:cytoskeletal protein CcmA (bactofilin family)